MYRGVRRPVRWALWGELPDLLSLTGVLLWPRRHPHHPPGGPQRIPPAELPDETLR